MSHAFSALAGGFLAIGALKTSAAEPYWGWLFAAVLICAIVGAIDAENKR